jgi:hypothetical protein
VTAELDWQLGLAPAIRMALHGYQAEFGGLPATVWRVPGTVTLLASGPLRLTVAAPWSAVAAAGRTEDGVIELVLMERPGEHERVPAAAAAAGHGPAWAGGGLALAGGRLPGGQAGGPDAGGPDGGDWARPAGYAGTRLLIRSELPEWAGVGMSAAIETAIRLSLGHPAARGPQAEHAPGRAVLGGRAVPCDLAAAGLRLMLVDTRVRRAARSAPAEESLAAEGAAAAAAGDFARLGVLLTGAHERQRGDAVQDAAVAAALRAGALGGRAITDGPGRPVLLLVHVDHVLQVRAEVGADFDRGGARPPRFLTFTPAAGPDRPARL